MTNVEKLEEVGILGDVRQRLGANDESDSSKDHKINEMDNERLVKEWCGWHLGDGSWWTSMKSYFDQLEELTNK
jgi:hypothetical protein